MRAVFTHTTLIFMLCLSMYFFQDETNQWFAYYHNLVAKGQVWRLLSAHLCHTNGYHLLINSIGLLIVVALFIDTFKKYTLIPLCTFSGLFIAITLFYFESNVHSYVGLSGVLHGLFAFAICDELRKKERWAYILTVGFIIKISWEQLNGPSTSTESLIEATVLTNAHLYGAASGIVYFSFTWIKESYKSY